MSVENVYPLDGGLPDATTDPVTLVGGKAANLTELHGAGFPVPDGFVVTADAYRRFLETAGIGPDLASILDVEPDDPAAVAAAGERARRLVVETALQAGLAADIREAYADLAADRVAVRSSATAEDLPEASFAGQQDTFLNVTGGEAVVDRVRECWASLFTQRAITYRAEHAFDLDEVAIAVVVQSMVDAEKSGVLFTADPETGEAQTTVEATWGLGEAVVSGAVSPDNYVVDRETGAVESVTVNDKRVRFDRDPETGETIEQQVAPRLRMQRVLDETELRHLVELGERVEAHYGTPQDVEWAIRDGEVMVLQSRPITTIDAEAPRAGTDATPDEATVTGLGASGGRAAGRLSFDPVDAVKRDSAGESVVLVRPMTSPSDLHGMKAAVAIVTSQGGTTSHAAIVSRELDTPAVVGCDELAIDTDAGELTVGDRVLCAGDWVHVDGDAGHVTFPE